ncbi:acyltransferase family protein [Crocinitomix catalasitica]|uniref:acyltransferase family protein n=1 Tax=Crocinitomix catalasitica TaxID=184607 RepID=UPI000486F0EE|nr:acyltransferase [Crocinitomix catalasitica]
MENKQHLNHIEFIRAIAALSVALFHFTNHTSENIPLIANEDIRQAFHFGAQGVEMFYIISGFIIPYALYYGGYHIRDYFQYLGKRLSRLLPPYFIVLALITIWTNFLFEYVWLTPYNIQWRQLFANGFFMVDFINAFEWLKSFFPDNTWINPIFLTLKVELQFYLLIGLLFPLITKSKWLFAGIAIFLLLFGLYTNNANTFFVSAPYFLLGLCTFFIRQIEKHWVYYVIAGIILLDLAYFYMPQDLVVSLITFILVLGLPSQFKFFNITGKISYSFYLIHGLTGQQFLYFTRSHYLTTHYPYLMIIFALIISWVAAYLLYKLVEKPSIILSKKFKYKRIKNKYD